MRAVRSFRVGSFLLAAVLAAASPALVPAAPASAEAQLVMLAEPQPPAGVAASRGAVTLPYRVVEIFSGEPGSASVIVRHPQLESADRERLASGERLIVMARPDADNPGRWLGSAPLRATDEAVAAFRKWGAPSDVRAATPLSDAVAVAKRSQGEVPAPEVVVESEAIVAAPEWHDVPAAEPEPTRSVPEPAPLRSVVITRDDEAPMSFHADAPPDPSLLPARGPGLPPSPTHRILGPAFADRADLKLANDDKR